MDDRAIVAAQLGRQPRSTIAVRARCHLGLPVVIEVPPFLEDGTPFPTRYWLTCPLAVRRISRLEAAGGVKLAERRIASDPEFARKHGAAMARYADTRDADIPEDWTAPRPTGGVGGLVGDGVKCLHAHYADTAAGNSNPVGDDCVSAVEPLDCVVPCVIDHDEAGAMRNPQWRERARRP